MGTVRVRQHVNPLSQKYQSPVEPPVWEKVYAVVDQPLHLDIGSGRGHFLLDIARQRPSWNFLGLEIREPLVLQASDWRDELGLTNLHFVFCNASNSLQPLLSSLPEGRLAQVTIQFPDPWFKKRHQKRRIVQPQLVDLLSTFLIEGGIVLLQSDVEAVARDMCDRFDEHPAFEQQGTDWLPENPLGVPTERERVTLERGDPVYRALFIKRSLG